jgi:hypothetical protein
MKEMSAFKLLTIKNTGRLVIFLLEAGIFCILIILGYVVLVPITSGEGLSGIPTDPIVVTPTLVPADEEPDPFEFDSNILTINTSLMEMKIEGGAIVYIRDKASGEILVNTNAYTNRPLNNKDFIGFTSLDTDSATHLKWPVDSSQVSYIQLSANRARLTYMDLDSQKITDKSQLVFDIVIDQTSGEVVIQLTAFEAEPLLWPSAINLPIMNIAKPAVILGSGVKYLRGDADATDQTTYTNYGLYSPTMAVVEGKEVSLAVWSETTQFVPEYIRLDHNTSNDQIILHSDRGSGQVDAKKIVSPPWRIGTYPTWVNAAKRWRELFEERTGAKPLWENSVPWVRDIHAIFDTQYQDYQDSETKYAELAGIVPPDNLLFFMWNGDRIVLFGDHTLAAKIGRPTSKTIEILGNYGWHLILYNPFVLINSETGSKDRLQFLSGRGWLPPEYQFTPEYEGEPDEWQNYWSEIKTKYYDGSRNYILHPGSTAFQNYLIKYLQEQALIFQLDGAYFDGLGADHSGHFPNNKKIIEGQDYVAGEVNAIQNVQQNLPNLAIMSEYQSSWMLPFVFFSWEGSATHIKQNSYVHTRLNHPIRVALTGSYSWTHESNEIIEDDIVSALMGTLPQINLVGDNMISDERAVWSQARARLFCEEELFNDIPDVWDDDSLAYYRSKSGNWFKFVRMNSTYGYVEILPDGTGVIRLVKP